ncbi:MAG: nitrous oxide reductase accessory protein NosL [Proteobacteria bacterium]|nr:nitrous oxide reductase accessory protein NosL [Pseudomonadota bacterium]
MSRKKLLLVGFIICINMFWTGTAFSEADIDTNKACSYCGMDRGQFSHSRMLIIYDDGTELAVCSLHCAAVDLAIHLDKTPKTIKVGDYNTKKLIDAEQALWVIGGTKPGVMTKRGKWAFERKADADAFIKANGGSIATFDEAIKATYEDMYADTKMIREKRKMMKQKKMSH